MNRSDKDESRSPGYFVYEPLSYRNFEMHNFRAKN